jgi:hypothetical protein
MGQTGEAIDIDGFLKIVKVHCFGLRRSGRLIAREAGVGKSLERKRRPRRRSDLVIDP